MKKAVYDKLSTDDGANLCNEMFGLFERHKLTRLQAMDVLTTMLVMVMRDLWTGEEYREAAVLVHENVIMLNELCEKMDASLKH